jgi:hypothetical protein
MSTKNERQDYEDHNYGAGNDADAFYVRQNILIAAG